MKARSAHPTAVDGLAELARFVRASTLELLHVPDPSWLTWAPPGTSNHIFWHAGHALWLQDALTIRPLTGQSELPSGWAQQFAQKSPRIYTQNGPMRLKFARSWKINSAESNRCSASTRK